MRCNHEGARVIGGIPKRAVCSTCGETVWIERDVEPEVRTAIEALYARSPAEIAAKLVASKSDATLGRLG
ncbi:MAG TPA: hypothetical protein VLT45_21020 [Kofleriaceae bacterium]|nr:hypothetical protein [Kofleriaceae bacterium]